MSMAHAGMFEEDFSRLSTISTTKNPNTKDYHNDYSHFSVRNNFTHCKITLYNNMGDVIKTYDGIYDIITNIPGNIIFKDKSGNMYYIYNTTGLVTVEIDTIKDN